MRTDLCAEAIRLGRLMRTLMAPPPAEVTALLALMLLHDSRRDARLDEAGELVVLAEQDRRRWDQRQIAEALPMVDEALQGGPGPLAVQAAIAALHCRAARAEDTDWPQILGLYDLLERLQPSPVVSLNRAVAVAMVHGPRAGACAHRCARSIWRCRRLPPAAFRARRSVAPRRLLGGSREKLCASARAGHQ